MTMGNINFFFLIRFDRSPDQTWTEFFYDESVQSESFEYNGRSVCLLKLKYENSAKRAVADGWVDITGDVQALEQKQLQSKNEDDIVIDEVDTSKKKPTKRRKKK